MEKANQNLGPVCNHYGEWIFDFRNSPLIEDEIKKEMIHNYEAGIPLKKEHAKIVADAVTKWAIAHGVTHYCHWFQPLTGQTAEKHDSFLSFDKYTPIQKLHYKSLMTGEPDASSFPNGGTRATFEARGYTSWDLTSPMFLMPNKTSATLCIPTAFVSYTGAALDAKTPLLKSIDKLTNRVLKGVHLIEGNDSLVDEIIITCGAEQEYFLIDKKYLSKRPDIAICGRTLLGNSSSKDQQMNDHYLGAIKPRVLNFMQELDEELYRLGVPSKTRHNEVAPCQFEIAPLYTDENLAADHNHIIMIKLKEIADRHGFHVLLHEKPFNNINGSGKHLNWSLSDNLGRNLLNPGSKPQENLLFIYFTAAVIEAVNRFGAMLRYSTATHSNDLRLGGHEAPPTIMSVFLGLELTKMFEAIENGTIDTYNYRERILTDAGSHRLANYWKDNSDRNRTSPFAFTGNRFEFRTVGSLQSIGIPLSILNTAVSKVLSEFNLKLERELANNVSTKDAVMKIVGESFKNSKRIIHNGNGYNREWVEEAASRGLVNLKNTIEALEILKDKHEYEFLIDEGILTEDEIKMRYNVGHKMYLEQTKIDIATFQKMIIRSVIPSALEYKSKLLPLIQNHKMKLHKTAEEKINVKLSYLNDELYELNESLYTLMKNLPLENDAANKVIINEVLPLVNSMRSISDQIEYLIPDTMWQIPRYGEMFFMS